MRFTQLKTVIASQFARPHGNEINYLILGKPGGGKTALCREIGKELGFDHVVEFNASLRDPVDLLGTPNNDGGTTKWVKPDDLAVLEHGRNLLIVEEITDCNMPMQNALCRLIYDKNVGTLKLSDETFVVATGNRTEDKSGAVRLSTKLGNRMRVHTFDEHLDDWVNGFALPQNLDPVLIQFIRFRPNLLSDFDPNRPYGINPTPRSWATVDKIDPALPKDLFFAECAGSVGEGAAAEYASFRAIYAALVSFEDVVMNPTGTPIPEDLAAQYAIVGSLAHNTTIGNIDRVAQYVERMKPDFGVMYWMDTRKKTPAVKGTKAYVKWATANANVILG